MKTKSKPHTSSFFFSFGHSHQVFLVTRDHAPQAVLRIHESLVRIRIRGSIPLTNKQKKLQIFVVVVDVLKVTAKMAESGSGSVDPYL